MTKLEIDLWWQLMVAKAAIRFHCATNMNLWRSCKEHMIARDHTANFWMRVQRWADGE
jgi:hypothetical protein